MGIISQLGPKTVWSGFGDMKRLGRLFIETRSTSCSESANTLFLEINDFEAPSPVAVPCGDIYHIHQVSTTNPKAIPFTAIPERNNLLIWAMK